ncbi:hypothetical protein DWQ65_11470 [Treponema phagedenis]|uniref:Transposase n=1 Tax=Treponema phagedenis TaxID=162 RepID=A0A0B7GS91_TREPH|nr:hypothetical protein [Treponema phagedenis]QSI00666.1 hypothetical protein DWQ65_11470 [Treponema phagedenis]CEM61328.1 hypothetical protein TPHV1_170059 [Treponema phagedenis]
MKKSTIFAYIFYTYENADGKKDHPVCRYAKRAKNLGISYGTLTDWRKTKNRYKASDGAATAKAIVLDERERQLQREIKELKEANEILQGALGFFR